MEIWKACLYLHFYILLEGECHGKSVIPKHLFMITADTWNLVQESSLTSVVAGMAKHKSLKQQATSLLARTACSSPSTCPFNVSLQMGKLWLINHNLS